MTLRNIYYYSRDILAMIKYIMDTRKNFIKNVH